MKNLVILVSTIILTTYCYAQQPVWREMQTFHDLVSSSLHPVETGNLQPVKKNSGALLAAAEKWKSSSVPVSSNYAGIQNDLDMLVSICSQLDEAIKTKKSSVQIKKLSLSLHNHFHVILSNVEKNHIK